MDLRTATEALRREVPAEVLDLVTLGCQERGAGLGVDGIDGLQRDPHLVVGAVQPAGVDNAAPGLAVLVLAGEESDDFRQCSVPRIEREPWFDVCPGSLGTAPGHLLICRWCDGSEERTLPDRHWLIEWPRLTSRP